MSDEQQDWQPVRIAPVSMSRNVHTPEANDYDGRHTKAQGKIVRVRPFPEEHVAIGDFRKGGCDSHNFYVVHPEDASLLGEWTSEYHKILVCEHQILAD